MNLEFIINPKALKCSWLEWHGLIGYATKALAEWILKIQLEITIMYESSLKQPIAIFVFNVNVNDEVSESVGSSDVLCEM